MEKTKVRFRVPPESRMIPDAPLISCDERLVRWKVFYVDKLRELLEDLVKEQLKKKGELARRWGCRKSRLSNILQGNPPADLYDLVRLFWYVIKGNPRWEQRFWRFMRDIFEYKEDGG